MVNAERRRLDEANNHGVAWRRWGPYLSDRQWGTARVYRWGEDGLAGLCDDTRQLCLALSLWNGHDPILKGRLFGLTKAESRGGGAGYSIRPALASDAGFLADMLVEAVNWSTEWRPKSRDRVLSAPDSAHYVTGWPRDTDLGVLADADGQPVGAAWLRFLPASDPGYGFVAADVPELTIGVAAGWRGRGVGRALLRAIAGQARARGIARISLSVERKNYAQRLYLSEGYRVVDSSGAQSDTMIKDLG